MLPHISQLHNYAKMAARNVHKNGAEGGSMFRYWFGRLWGGGGIYCTVDHNILYFSE